MYALSLEEPDRRGIGAFATYVRTQTGIRATGFPATAQPPGSPDSASPVRRLSALWRIPALRRPSRRMAARPAAIGKSAEDSVWGDPQPTLYPTGD
jgi:hypothetical protein